MKNSETDKEIEYIYAPRMKEFFESKKENETVKWIPVQCSLLFSDELGQICTTSRYIYFAFLLLCGVRGCCEIPFRVNYLAQTLGVNKRTLVKGINELLGAKMLHQRERKREEKEEESTDSTERESVAVECGINADLRIQDSKFKIQNSDNINSQSEIPIPKSNKSQFSIDECFRYVEICRAKGEDIKNAKGLANHIFKTGEADAFISAVLFPEKQTEIDRKKYGEPRQFSDEPCKVCFGAKMANVDGKGFRKCTNCLDEKGKAMGWEPVIGDK